jgi:predicted MPP superfamily phosphohydrolase
MRFSLIQILLSLVLLAIQALLFRRFLLFSAKNDRFRRIRPVVGAIFGLFNLPLVIGLLLRVFRTGVPAWVSVHLLPPVYLWHFISVVLFLILLVGALLKLPFVTTGWILGRFESTARWLGSIRARIPTKEFDSRRRQAIRQSLTIVTGGIALGSAYEVYREDTFDTTGISIPVKNLPESFHGFTIGFISDVHSGIFMSGERMRSYAEAVNGLGADMIVVTGDFVNSQLEETYPFSEAFNILSARYGVFGVLGNHDFYTRRVDDVAAEVERGGIELLRNRWITIGKGGDRLLLSGVDDTGSRERAARLFGAVSGGREEPGTRILLCHRPYFFPEAAATGFNLILSGHTHGGQVVLGELGKDVLAPARLVSPYVAGLYSEGDSKMYVSRGIGTVGVPFRFNCPPEVTKITLERAPA